LPLTDSLLCALAPAWRILAFVPGPSHATMVVRGLRSAQTSKSHRVAASKGTATSLSSGRGCHPGFRWAPGPTSWTDQVQPAAMHSRDSLRKADSLLRIRADKPESCDCRETESVSCHGRIHAFAAAA